MKIDFPICSDVLVSFNHYSRADFRMYPHWIHLRLSEVKRIEPCDWLNEHARASDPKERLTVYRRAIDSNGYVRDEAWPDWFSQMKGFYSLTLSNGYDFVVSKKTADRIVDIMEKTGLQHIGIFEDENG